MYVLVFNDLKGTPGKNKFTNGNVLLQTNIHDIRWKYIYLSR